MAYWVYTEATSFRDCQMNAQPGGDLTTQKESVMIL